MGFVSKIQPAFSSGALSPFLWSRVDLARYQTGLRTAKNFFIHPHGGASNRVGTKYVARVKDSTKRTRIVKFIFSETQSYRIEFGDLYVRFYKDHGQVLKTSPDAWTTSTPYVVGDFIIESSVTYYCIVDHTSGTFATDLAASKWVAQEIYEVPTTYTEDEIFDLKFESSADVLYIFHSAHKPATLSRFADDDWVLADEDYDDGPFMPENVDPTVLIACSGTSGTSLKNLTTTAPVFNSDHVGALFKLTHYIGAQLVSTAVTNTAAGNSISCFTTWRVVSRGTWTGEIHIEKSSDNGSTWTTLRSFSSVNDFNINTFGTEDVELNPVPFLIRIKAHAWTSGTANVDLTSDSFYQDGIVRIATVTNATAATASVLTVLGSTAGTVQWSEGAWSDFRGYPEVGAFHEDRLCFAAGINIWMTQTGNYKSFRVNQTVLDTDAINIKMRARQLNSVNNLSSLGDLIALTSATEWRIGADKTVLAPSTVFSKVQGYRGGAGVTPVIVGNKLVYVQANGSVIRSFGFDFSIDSYTGVDLRILSEHFFSNYSIVEMDYQQDPDSLIWCIRSDGKFLSLTYMEEQDVIAWTEHETDGEVESFCVTPGDGYDEPWMIVNRDGERFVEYMPKRMVSIDPQDQYFVDCGITYDSPVEITNATNENPVVVTAPAHGFDEGDLVDISDVIGMVELNGKRFKIMNVTTDTFELFKENAETQVSLTTENEEVITTEDDKSLTTEELLDTEIDGTEYHDYISGGYVRKVFTTFSGYDHLEGREVAILGNGEVYPNQVVTNGEISLSRGCSRVHAGLGYTADFETLNVELALKGGTAQGKQMKISNVMFRVINSRGGYIGPNFNELHEGFIPVRQELGQPPELVTDDIWETLGAGFEDGGRVCYRQVDPLPITIGCVIPQCAAY